MFPLRPQVGPQVSVLLSQILRWIIILVLDRFLPLDAWFVNYGRPRKDWHSTRSKTS